LKRPSHWVSRAAQVRQFLLFFFFFLCFTAFLIAKGYAEGTPSSAELLDMLSKGGGQDVTLAQKAVVFDEHLAHNELELGIKNSRFIKGVFNVSTLNCLQVFLALRCFCLPLTESILTSCFFNSQG